MVSPVTINMELRSKMKPRYNLPRALGLLLFFAGALLGMVLFASLVWADLESVFYFGYGVKGDQKLALSCPLITTAADRSPEATAFIKNTSDRSIQPFVQADISNVLAVRSDRTRVPVNAHQTVPVHWPLTSEDIVFGNMILVHVYQFSAYPMPSADGNCGSLYLGLHNLNGFQVLIVALAATLLGIVGGIALWAFNSRPLEGGTREQLFGMIALAVVVGVGLLVGWFGAWIPGVLLAALAVILMWILLGRYVLAPGQA